MRHHSPTNQRHRQRKAGSAPVRSARTSISGENSCRRGITPYLQSRAYPSHQAPCQNVSSGVARGLARCWTPGGDCVGNCVGCAWSTHDAGRRLESRRLLVAWIPQGCAADRMPHSGNPWHADQPAGTLWRAAKEGTMALVSGLALFVTMPIRVARGCLLSFLLDRPAIPCGTDWSWRRQSGPARAATGCLAAARSVAPAEEVAPWPAPPPLRRTRAS